MRTVHHLLSCGALALAVVVAGCATDPAQPPDTPAIQRVVGATPAKGSVIRAAAIDREVEDRILALDPEHISEADVATTLSKAPAPQIMLLHGGVYPVHVMMESTGKFLVGMGYPESRIRHPGDRRWSHSPYEDSAHLAGLLAWYYEHEGVRPMMIGHSQGGIQAVKVLYEMAGKFEPSIPVWDPYTDKALDRTTIIDPLTGAERPVVGLVVSYTSTIGAGGMTLLLPNQWSMLDKMYTIPDTVEEYTGISAGSRPDRLERDVGGERKGDRAQRAASVRVQPPDHPVCRAARRRCGGEGLDRRLRPGAGKIRTRRNKASDMRSSGRPTSGTASRSTGPSKRSG